ncbi:MAG: lipopolysaccharide kinase InaA family protein [Immundisolibacter sp.]|uniref:lipopolysaccharide kinase InaA family protein n=1 Tax=Immundisolibacter sp. TaxID=1934948 RepID=UPI003D129A7D
MSTTPSLPLRLDLPELGAVVCTRALRVLPGRRWTLAGATERGARAVVVKLFLAGRHARRDFRREQRGFALLHRHAISAPQVLYAGALAEPAGWVVVTAALDGTPADALGEAALPAVVRAVALQHAEGIEQRDAHLGNFLIADGLAWTLDGAGIRASRALSARRARHNLARWLAQYPPGIDRRSGELLTLYRTTRWDRGRVGSGDGFRNHIARERRERERRQVAKSLRTCGAYIASRTWRRFSVIDRAADTPALRAWLAAPDAPFDDPQAVWLKRGRSASVVRLTLDGRDVVVKRYNLKDFLHRLRRFWRPSRAWQSWRAAQRLLLWGVPTPKPVALLEERFGPLRGRAFYVSEYARGEPLATALPTADPPTRALLLKNLCALLGTLARLRLSHGDLKATNLLVDNDNTLMLLDLDALRRHRRRDACFRALARDVARLRANWADQPALLAELDRALADAGLAP